MKLIIIGLVLIIILLSMFIERGGSDPVTAVKTTAPLVVNQAQNTIGAATTALGRAMDWAKGTICK